MDKPQITDKVKSIIAAMFHEHSEKLTETTSLSELKDFDSFERVNLYLKVEKEFNFKLSTQDMLTINSIGDIIEAVQKALSVNPA